MENTSIDSLFKGGLIVLGTLAACCTIVFSYAVFDSKREERFNLAYQRALIEYGDRDHNKFISNEERNYFERGIYPRILLDHDAMIVSKDPVYIPNGEKVSKSTLTQWLDDYRPSERSE